MFQVILIILLIIAVIIVFRKGSIIQYHIFGNFRLYKIDNIKYVYDKSMIFCDINNN